MRSAERKSKKGGRNRQLHELAETAAGELLSRSLTVAVAESCTGGLLADLLTDVPGISKSFRLGVVAYSNDAKRRVLGIDAALMDSEGAVSAAAAGAMAASARVIGGTDAGIGVTGIAGPSGGSRTKPVGLVYVGVELPPRRLCRQYLFEGSRREIKEAAAAAALELLLEVICSEKSTPG